MTINFKQQVQYIHVTSEHVDRRLDNFLFSVLKNVPKSLLYRFLRKGEIRVNKKRSKPDCRLKEGDIIRIAPLYQSENKNPSKSSMAMLESISKNVLFEDEYLLVLNKPAFLPVHGGTDSSVGVIDVVRELWNEGDKFELVHRLDKETSGCLIIAKKHSVLREIHQEMLSRKIHKEYIALTLGQWSNLSVSVKLPLLKNILQSGERVVKVSDEGKEAHTEFKVLKTFGIASLVKAVLHTGRTHQIRVHAQSQNHPIAGDQKYGDKAFNRIMKRDYNLNRLFLHAGKIAFRLPSKDREYKIEAPLGDDLLNVLKLLEEKEK